jgi:hypothetical protein
VILFAIDCSESMLELRDDPNYEDSSVKTCHIMAALDAAMQIQKKKVIVGPNDLVGIMFFNTVRLSIEHSSSLLLTKKFNRAVKVTGQMKVLRSNVATSYSSLSLPSVHQKYKSLFSC